jgi:hypothetical protein
VFALSAFFCAYIGCGLIFAANMEQQLFVVSEKDRNIMRFAAVVLYPLVIASMLWKPKE